MGDESGEMHSEDDKAIQEKNKKRIVKTPYQLEALEKFYNEHKYPAEYMKIKLAEAIGLTEKQVSGWFCHRRLKDKKLMSGDNYPTGKQDRSSGVIQDRGSGHRQDSCSSTKQGDDRNFDTKEVESGRLISKGFSAPDLAYERGSQNAGKYSPEDDATSGSTSSLRSMSNRQGRDAFNEETPYLIPKFPSHETQVKARSGPSGYLKVKGRVENAAVTAVKRQLGNHYREDGPPLGVEFDPLPPGAFESQMQEPVEDMYFAEETVPPALSNVSRVSKNPKFSEAHDYEPSMVPYNAHIDGPSFKARRFHSPDNHMHKKNSRLNTSSTSGSAYYSHRNSLVEPFEGSARDISRTRKRPGLETTAIASVPSHANLQPYVSKMKEEQAESCFHKYNGPSFKEHMKNGYPDTIITGNARSLDKGLSRHVSKEGKLYPGKKNLNENQFKASFNNDFSPPIRIREEFPPRQNLKTSPMLDNLANKSYPDTRLDLINKSYPAIRSGKVIPSNFSEDEQSAETSSSLD